MPGSPTAGDAAAQPAPHPPLPESIGKYKILSLVGRGSMGTVYKAHDPDLDRFVAIKTVAKRPSDDNEDDIIRRFQEEARSAARLSHPRIVTVFDFGQLDGEFYFVMELLEGSDLAAVIRRRTLTSFEIKLELAEQITDGVAFAHSQGMVHRDLKPGNIHISPDGQSKILDFGLAKTLGRQQGPVGWIEGTPQYMSPEQVRGHAVDVRSDIFSLGCIFYEIFTYRRCFPADSVHSAMFQVLERNPEPVRTIDSTLPKVLELLIIKAMSKKAEERFHDASDLRQALMWVRKVAGGQASESQAIATLEMTAISGPGSSIHQIIGSINDGLVASPTTATSTVPSISSSVQDPGTLTGSFISPLVEKARITFVNEPGGGERLLEIQQPGESSLLQLALDNNVNIFHECGGTARCSTCRVRVVSGPSGLTPRSQPEKKLAARLGWGDDIRLACQAQLIGDVAVHRLIRDSEDFGLLHFETNAAPPMEAAVAMLVCGIQNFADFLKRAEPYDVVHILNRYFLQIGEPVITEGGIIERYLGEGLVAHFGHQGGSAQDKCTSAVRAGLNMIARMKDFNRYLRSHFNAEFRFGIGLHFGRVIVGHVGHPSQMHVTTIGNAATKAAWLGALKRSEVGPILATEDLINVIEGEINTGQVIHETGPEGREETGYEVVDFVTPNAVVMVQQMFHSVRQIPQEAAEVFYRLLFEIDPSAQPMFEGIDMMEQGEKLMTMLVTLVDNLQNLEGIRHVAVELGERHRGYGVRLQHYDSVEQALLETFRLLLGEAFTVDLRLAWSQIYNQMVGIMIEGATLEENAPLGDGFDTDGFGGVSADGI